MGFALLGLINFVASETVETWTSRTHVKRTAAEEEGVNNVMNVLFE